jgi:hypothetical protein
VRVAELVSAPADVGVELVPRNEAGPDPAGDRPQLPVADQSANLVSEQPSAAESSRTVRGAGRSMPEPYAEAPILSRGYPMVKTATTVGRRGASVSRKNAIPSSSA